MFAVWDAGLRLSICPGSGSNLAFFLVIAIICRVLRKVSSEVQGWRDSYQRCRVSGKTVKYFETCVFVMHSLCSVGELGQVIFVCGCTP